MAKNHSFIKDILRTLYSAVEVEDWFTIKELIDEIEDYLEEDNNDYI